MAKIKAILNQKQSYEKVLSVIGIICSISIIILACIQIFGAWNNAINVLEPLLGVLMMVQGIQNWKKNKLVSIISLCSSIFIFIITICIFIIR